MYGITKGENRAESTEEDRRLRSPGETRGRREERERIDNRFVVRRITASTPRVSGVLEIIARLHNARYTIERIKILVPALPVARATEHSVVESML